MEPAQKFVLPFEHRYSPEYSMHYYQRHRKGLLKRFSNFLEQKMIAKAYQIAGCPKTVMDLPCGAGRFWQTFLDHGVEKIIAMDQAPGMLEVASKMLPPEVLKHVDLYQADIKAIPLADNAVESSFCLRLLHHIDVPEYRKQMYAELKRVSSKTVCISYWVDGNLKSFRNLRKAGKNKNYLNTTLLENELNAAGLKVIGHVDMLKYYLPWRIYVCSVA